MPIDDSDLEPTTFQAVPVSSASTVADLIKNDPTFVAAVRQYYADLREDYLERVRDIEDLLGFLKSESDLSTRLANLERFTGIKVE